MGVSMVELQQYLQGMDYPSRKEGLLKKARDNSAPDEVIDLINNLPDRDFRSAADVSRAVGDIE